MRVRLRPVAGALACPFLTPSTWTWWLFGALYLRGLAMTVGFHRYAGRFRSDGRRPAANLPEIAMKNYRLDLSPVRA